MRRLRHLVPFVLLALAACRGDEPIEPIARRVFLLNRPPDTIELAQGSVRMGTVNCGEEYRRALAGAADEPTWFRDVARPGALLRFEVGFGGVAEGDASFRFEVLARDEGEARTLWSTSASVPRSEAEWDWTPVEIPLPSDATQELGLRVVQERGEATSVQPLVANPSLALSSPLPPSRAGNHNVVLVLADTLRADHLGLYGNPADVSPFLDSLADEALVFAQANSSAPWTKASVASLLTSRHPSLHGAVDYLSRMRDTEETLGHVFTEHGYRTAGFGFNKWVFSPKFNLGAGFERWVEVVDRTGIRETRAGAVVDEAIDWLDQNYETPFLLYVHLIDPHAPYAPPGGFRERFVDDAYAGELDGHLEGPGSFLERGAEDVDAADLAFLRTLYEAEIAYVDEQVERLATRLRRLGVWDETTFVFVSDHGEAFMDHDTWGHGGTLFQEQLHVPLLVKPPHSAGLEPRRIDAPVGLVDVAPTVAQLSGLDVRERPFMGQSLLTAHAAEARTLIAEGWGMTSLRSGEWKYIVEGPSGEALYRLSNDPGELQNVLDDAPRDLVEGLRSTLRLHRERAAREGLFLELTGDGEERLVRVFLRAVSGKLDFNLLQTESLVDEFVSLGSGDQEAFRIDLRLGAGDEDGLVLRLDEGTQVDVGIFVDDQPLPVDRLRVGPSGDPAPANPWTLARDDARLAPGRPAELPADRDPGVWGRLWRIEEADVVLSAEDEAALRAIGY